jgi:iron-sulfur cluster assembly protein
VVAGLLIRDRDTPARLARYLGGFSDPMHGGELMLTITQAAAEVLDSLVEGTTEPDSAGVRISRTAGEDGQPALQLAAVDSPEPQDAVLDGGAEHAPVFLEPGASVLLEDKVLDARVEGDSVALLVADRGDGAGGGGGDGG